MTYNPENQVADRFTVVKLRKTGNSWGLTLDKHVFAALGLFPGCEIQLHTYPDKKAAIIKLAHGQVAPVPIPVPAQAFIPTPTPLPISQPAQNQHPENQFPEYDFDLGTTRPYGYWKKDKK